MLRHNRPLSYEHMFVSDSETESDDNLSAISIAEPRKRNGKQPMIDSEKLGSEKNQKGKKMILVADEDAKPFKSKPNVDRDALVKLATEYQKYMKQKPIPKARLANTVVVNWKGFVKTLRRQYGQPLHYLTHMLCKQWDQSRFGSEDEEKPLDAIINCNSAEAAIWKVEEIHRLFTSPIHLAMLWLSDPEYRAIVDEAIPPP